MVAPAQCTADPILTVSRVKQMTHKPALFAKKPKLYQTASYYGPSLLSTNGEIWKRHRQVAGPAFGIGFDKQALIAFLPARIRTE